MLIPFKPETSQPVYVGIEYGNLCSCLNVCVQFCLVDFVLYKKGEKAKEKKVRMHVALRNPCQL